MLIFFLTIYIHTLKFTKNLLPLFNIQLFLRFQTNANLFFFLNIIYFLQSIFKIIIINNMKWINNILN